MYQDQQHIVHQLREKLDRLGLELGAKVSTFSTDKVELSAGYLTRLREDYQDHTFTFDVKYDL